MNPVWDHGQQGEERSTPASTARPQIRWQSNPERVELNVHNSLLTIQLQSTLLRTLFGAPPRYMPRWSMIFVRLLALLLLVVATNGEFQDALTLY